MKLKRLAVSFALSFGPVVAASPLAAQDLAERLTLCATCHGEQGLPEDPEIPIIWGQNFYYLYVQLKDYQAERRSHETMSPIAADMTKEEMQALAKHFSEQPWPQTSHSASPGDVKRAEAAAVAGVCTECHLGNYHGSSGVPRVAGQQPTYLLRTMLDLKNKVRQNAPAKSSLFATFPEEDLAALAEYLAAR